MEALQQPPLQNVTTEAVKVNVVTCEESSGVETSMQSNVCHKPNGVSDSKDSEQVQPSLDAVDATEIPTEEHPSDIVAEEEIHTETIVTEQEPSASEIIIEEITASEGDVHKDVPIIEEQNIHEIVLKTDHNEDMHTEHVEIDGIVETMPENVRFETEILIETNVDDQPSKYKIIFEDESSQADHANNILNEFGQNIELSEVLRSSDISENVENNNCDVAQEVFNKEELLDILEGNDMEETRKVISENFASDCKKLETQLALQQLSRLKQTRKSRNTPKKYDKKTSKKSDSPKEESVKKRTSRQKEDGSQANDSAISEPKDESLKKKSKQKDENLQVNSDATPEPREESGKKKSGKQKDENLHVNSDATPEPREESGKKKSGKQKDDNEQNNSDTVVEPKDENIVNALVKDWEDDEPTESDEAKKLKEESDKIPGESEDLEKSQEAANSESKIIDADVSTADTQTLNLNKSESETPPQRRLGRVIKKKVIFDPDNPDTFTKSKVVIKKENQSEKDQKDQPTPKKIKTDPTSPQTQAKSLVQSKLQWKKPQPKNIKQNKRLTEIDRLLMDEGAVNMICQLTPEAPQGNKNVKSKAEFIKKIQSSTPEGKEMKFRERVKKESKSEDLDPRRVCSSKDRLSLGASVKSPSVSEDFEAHSADDSIIYRRHSSSSYSSPCMSPRRLSDVESINQNATATTQQAASHGQLAHQEVGAHPGSDVFMAETAGKTNTTVINKSDFLSIKEKLNSKLSLAMNKRKRESTKAEKPTKIKKVAKSLEKVPVVKEYKYIQLTIEQKLAEICIQKCGTIFNVEVMNELKTALEVVEGKNDISVTLLTAEPGTLCSGFELGSVLHQEKGADYALELAESARLLLVTLESHSKFVCTAVEDRCYGLGLSLVALSDVTVASEIATFELSAFKGAPLVPGAAALTSGGLSQSLVNELIVFERPVSAAQALHGGLVSRTLWPERVQDQARAIAKEIAAQSHEIIMLKKQLLRLKKGTSESFLSGLQIERDLFINYWTSEEGRKSVRASLEVAKE